MFLFDFQMEETSSTAFGVQPVPTWNRRSKLELMRQKLNEGDKSPLIWRQLAISEGGLMTDEIRKEIWPILSCSLARMADPQEPESVIDDDSDSEDELQKHREYAQVDMDVKRTLARFPPNIDMDERYRLQTVLTPLIVRVLRRYPKFRYYQGFHDVCLTVLLALGDPKPGLTVCCRLARYNFVDFLEKSLEIATDSLYLMYPLLKRVDAELYQFLRRSQVGVMFALSWQLTWFAHVVDEYTSVVRLYDLFIASHPLMPVYLATSIVLFRSPEILALECDMAPVHACLSKIPDNLPLDALIADAQDLFLQYPPSTLREMQFSLKKEERRLGSMDLRSSLKLQRRQRSWPLLFSGNPTGGKAMKLTFYTVTAAVAAWLLYTRYPTGMFRVV